MLEAEQNTGLNTESKDTFDKMQNYIVKYSCDPTFSIKIMAEYFSMSVLHPKQIL